MSDYIEWEACVYCDHGESSHHRHTRACLRISWRRWWFRRCTCKQYLSWTEFSE